MLLLLTKKEKIKTKNNNANFFQIFKLAIRVSLVENILLINIFLQCLYNTYN